MKQMKKLFKILGGIFLFIIIWLILGMFFDPVFKIGFEVFLTISGIILALFDFITGVFQ